RPAEAPARRRCSKRPAVERVQRRRACRSARVPRAAHLGCRARSFDTARTEIVKDRMQFGIFYEHQIPRPWRDGDEHKLFKDALDQVELADRLGIDVAWEVEHHFLEEYSHSSA